MRRAQTLPMWLRALAPATLNDLRLVQKATALVL